MRSKLKPYQALVVSTAAAAVLLFAAGVLYQIRVWPDPVYLETAGLPCLGKEDAPLELVLFEDFRCKGCRWFNQGVLPDIYNDYIKEGKARFSIIPLAFLHGSKPLANAAITVQHIAPDRFFFFVHELFQEFSEYPLQAQQLVEIAQKVGGIDLVKFEACVMTHCYYPELEKNLLLAKEIMGPEFVTPSLFANGVNVPATSYEVIRRLLDQILQRTVL